MNKILFLYTDQSEKADLILAADAVRTVLRKFRKNAVFSFVSIDLSLPCRSKLKKILSDITSDTGCAMFCGSKNTLSEELRLFSECFNTNSAQYFSSGKCICYPLTLYSAEKSDICIKENSNTDICAIEKAVSLSLKEAKQRKELLLCTNTEKETDRLIYSEFINTMADTQGISVEHFDFDEMIYSLTEKLPSCNVILTTQDKARIIAIHISALNKFPTGYTVFHGEKLKIYKKEIFPYGDFSNIPYASFLIACGTMLEKELGYKNAGMHLRKMAARTLEKCCFESRTDFQKNLLLEINKPLRHREGKTNEGDN